MSEVEEVGRASGRLNEWSSSSDDSLSSSESETEPWSDGSGSYTSSPVADYISLPKSAMKNGRAILTYPHEAQILWVFQANIIFLIFAAIHVPRPYKGV
jgi:hypothetical protein